jgi:ABC-type proline/glycine betaine transport system, ATPase component
MEGGRVVQVGTPEDILQNPADDYVRAFFRGVDPTGVISAGDIARDSHPTIIRSKTGSLRATHEIISGNDSDYAYILDPRRRFLGVVSADSVGECMERGAPDQPIDQAFIPNVVPVLTTDYMQDILHLVASRYYPIPVVDEDGRYKGVVSKNRFLRTLHRTEQEMSQPA